MKTHVYKLVLGLLLTLLLNVNSYAQDYEYIPIVKSGVQIWTTESSSEGFGGHYSRFALTEEDTIMDDGKLYKKLYFFLDSAFNHSTAECIGGIREEDKKVYYKGKASYDGEPWTTGLLCDFSLSVGDTFDVPPFWDLTVIVIDVDTVDFLGIQRRQIHLGFSDWADAMFKWIEGIGSDLGLLFATYQRFLLKINANGSLLCYLNNGELQYNNSGDKGCFPIIGLDEIKLEDNSINLYPNPTSKEVNISSENIINSIEIFNSLGQKLYQTNVKAKGKTLDINSLSKGVYIIGVSTDKGYVRKKLIKN